MGIIANATSWLNNTFRRGEQVAQLEQKLASLEKKSSQGERIMAGMLGTGWNYGGLGYWSADRYEQVRHFRGWNYVAIKAICEEFALVPPEAAYVRSPEQIMQKRAEIYKRFGSDGHGLIERDFAIKAYDRRILNKLARRKALADLQPHEELELIDSDHRLYRLLKNPNEPDTGDTFFYELMLYLELTGNTYIWVVPNRLGLPTELWVLPAHWVRPRPGPDRLIAYYEVRPIGFGTTAGMFQFPADEVIAIGYKHPLSKIDGLSPQQAISTWIDCSESIDASRFSTFKNGVQSSGVVEFDKEVSDPNPNDIARNKAEFRQWYMGERNAGVPIFLAPGGKWNPNTASPAEMAYNVSGDQMRDWQLAAYRVSKSIAGIDDSMTFASMVTSVANFVMRTMRPKRKMIGSILTEKLAHRFDPRLCVYWPDTTPDDPAQKLAEHIAYLDRGVETVNEVRQDIGREPYPHGGDDPEMPMGNAPVPYVTGEEPLDLSSLNGVQQPSTNGSGAGQGLPRLNGKSAKAPADPIRIHLPDLRQGTNYSCGASVTEAICEFFGVGPESEGAYMEALGTNPEQGTAPERIVAFCHKLGLDVQAKEGMTIDEVKEAIDAGRPVIVAIQAWAESETTYADDTNGHYVAAIGYDGRGIYFEDPAIKGTRGFLTYADFLARWHDDGEGRKYNRYGIVLWRAEQSEEIKGRKWSEGDHPRNAQGEFGTGGGGAAEAKPGKPGKPSPAETIHAQAAPAAKKLADRIKELPAHVYQKAKVYIAKKYAKLEARYGRGTALAIIGSGLVGFVALAPVPGGSLITAAPVLAIAELYHQWHGGKSVEWSSERLAQEGKQFIDDLLAGWEQEIATPGRTPMSTPG